MYDYLLEIFCEEIPARMQKNGAHALNEVVKNMFTENGISFKASTAYWTPRRLCLDIRGLSEYSKDKIIERKGPNINASEAAINGFLRSTGLKNISEATIIKNDKKGDYYFANILQKGESLFTIISKHMPEALKKVSWPKSMRWGKESTNLDSLHWVRPIQHITSVLSSVRDGTHIARFEFAGLTADNYTFGHRFMTKNKILTIDNFDNYVSQLNKTYVILDFERRKNLIKNDAINLAFANGLELVADDNLLEEVANLVEYPVILLGTFTKEFLQLPQKIIQTTIRENQKCFVTKEVGTDKLANKFIICANIKAPNNSNLIVKGNERVVEARLQDALYFYNKDLEQDNALDKFIEKLKPQNINAYTQLGSQADRLKRILDLSLFIAEQFNYLNKENIKRSVMLAKADLVSEMVMEFPNLQGYIGKEYALKQGEDKEVAYAIEKHYKPISSLDDVPKNPLSIILGLADKMDILAGFWFVNEKPSGSRDPFALRRTALGIVRLLLAQEKNISLRQLIAKALANYSAQDKQTDLYNFIIERFKNYLREEGARYDAIEAIITINNDDLLYQARMIEALILYLDSAKGKQFIQATKRIYNLLNNKITENKFDVNIEKAPEALMLYKKTQDILNALPENGKKDFNILNELIAPIEEFFDKVMVNDPNDIIKNNRLALLHFLNHLLEQFADFSKIVMN